MLGVKLAGNTLVIEERGGKCTCVHFDTKGKAISVGINMPNAEAGSPRFKSWKLRGTRSKWPNSQELGETDFWATLRGALRVSVGS